MASGSGAHTINSAVVLGGTQTWTNNSVNDLTVNGAVSGAAGLTKAGAGTIVLGGTNSYSGATAVNAGTLLVNGNQSAATGAVSVNNTGTTLGGTGNIGGATTVNAGANITGATDGTIGSLTLASLTFNGASGNLANFIVDLVGATSDTLNITGLLDLGGTFDALVFNGSPDGTSTYLLASFGSLNGTFNTAPSFAGYQYIYGLTTLELSPLTPVPEPSTWVAGALALLAVGYTQRRRFARKAALA